MNLKKIAELPGIDLFVDADIPENKWYAFDGTKMKKYRNIDTGEEMLVMEK
jgi:hypothetical protein